MIKTADGSYTLKSRKYNECYHSREGALKESLYKHVYPSFLWAKEQEYFGGEIKILDICFGLGYNTFVSIIERPKGAKLKIYSPELDEELVKSLKNFEFPKEFDKIKNVIMSVSDRGYYEDEFVSVKVAFEDAREFIKNLDSVDIVYQDAFSPKVNKELWSLEYFSDIKKILNPKGLITTYSVATPVRCALYKLGFNLYTHPYNEIRKGTIASLSDLPFEKVDFESKLKRVDCYYIKESNEDN
ncbi:MAG: hypothetical protein GXO62_07965 [Epsilonproteobacteria bacterium]|nr:hypothetical protein [Campylobacterota bacterium]